MDDDLQHLESELRRLRPVAPPSRLMRDIQTALTPPRRRTLPWHWLWALGLPAAAVVAVLLHRPAAGPQTAAGRSDRAGGAAEAGMLKPVAVENVLYAAHDEGFVTLDDGTRARRQRLRFVDTFTWRNPDTNASLRWSVPREEVRVLPVSYQ